MAKERALLVGKGIDKRFGGVQALSDVTFTIDHGEIYGLIGPNGAGKTSLFNVLTGIYAADGGEFRFDGKPLAGLKPHEVAARGIARTFQNIRLFANLSALENVMIGRHVRTHAGVWGAILRNAKTRAEERRIERRAYELLEYVGVAHRANDLARHLAYGDQRRLEIARALATDPKLLALDEPAAGMNATETESLKRLLEDIRHDGITILLIEHDMKLVMSVCDRVLVLDYGKKIAEGPGRRCAEGSESDRRVSRWRSHAKARGVNETTRAAPLLELVGVEVGYGGIQAVKGIDLYVEQGELVCLIGANGAGKTTTLKGICGLQPVRSGTIRYAGQDITGKPAFELVRQGLAMVPEGRGVFGALTIEENLAMGAYIRRDQKAIVDDVERVFKLFPRLKERRRQTAGTLSGGEQQMLAIGRALMSRPKLLLLDEPSMGLAPLMVQKVFETIITVSREGVTILLIEQNAKLALEVSHRGYVMESGEITLAGDAKRLLDDPAVRAAYLGETAA
jgi:ABC-type branched-subunit amino acid transport system ATPase component